VECWFSFLLRCENWAKKKHSTKPNIKINTQWCQPLNWAISGKWVIKFCWPIASIECAIQFTSSLVMSTYRQTDIKISWCTAFVILLHILAKCHLSNIIKLIRLNKKNNSRLSRLLFECVTTFTTLKNCIIRLHTMNERKKMHKIYIKCLS
jgi:hypothetical protein